MKIHSVILLSAVAIGCGGVRATSRAPEPARAGAPPSAAPSATPTATPESDGAGAPASADTELVDVLAGRLRVRMPAGARVAPLPHSIMGAGASDEDQTRVLIVPGQGEAPLARFVMLAREAFVLGTGDATADVAKLLGETRARYRIAPVAAGQGLGVVSYAPKDEPTGTPLFVLGALVERPDRSLVELNFYILNEMAAERASYEQQALAITASIVLGKGAVPGSKRVRLDPGTGKELVLDLPRAAVATRQEGPDFLVFHVREIGKVGEPGAEIGVYLGGYPSLQYKQADVPEKRVKKSSGTLLGKRTDWYSWQSDTGQTVSETMGSLGKHEKVHVFVAGPAARVTELRKAAEAMRAERKTR